jgi:hypothetical protein
MPSLLVAVESLWRALSRRDALVAYPICLAKRRFLTAYGLDTPECREGQGLANGCDVGCCAGGFWG